MVVCLCMSQPVEGVPDLKWSPTPCKPVQKRMDRWKVILCLYVFF